MKRMPPRQRFFSCPSCACHVKQAESHCPHCGAAIRRVDGSVPRTAAAVLLGLTAAVNASCGDVIMPMPEYGGPATGGAGGTVDVGGGGQGGDGGEGGSAGGQGGQ